MPLVVVDHHPGAGVADPAGVELHAAVAHEERLGALVPRAGQRVAGQDGAGAVTGLDEGVPREVRVEVEGRWVGDVDAVAVGEEL